MKKIQLQVNLGETPSLLDEKLEKFTKKDKYKNLSIKFIREGQDKKMVYIDALSSNGLLFNNGIMIECNAFQREFEKILSEYNCDYMW